MKLKPSDGVQKTRLTENANMTTKMSTPNPKPPTSNPAPQNLNLKPLTPNFL